MALILKSDPRGIDENNVFTSSAVQIYQQCAPHSLEEVFVWTSETARGMGLAMRGTFSGWSQQQLGGGQSRAVVRVSVAAQLSEQRLTVADLKRHDTRTNPGATGTLSTPCRKLYAYSKNKIARLDSVEVECLDNRFRGPTATAAPGFPEGRRAFRAHLTRERNNNAVRFKKANASRPLSCEVCDFRFYDRYLDGADFIECHHLRPLGSTGQRVTTQDELILVCANCHRIIHRHIRGDPHDPRSLSVAGLRQAILRP